MDNDTTQSSNFGFDTTGKTANLTFVDPSMMATAPQSAPAPAPTIAQSFEQNPNRAAQLKQLSGLQSQLARLQAQQTASQDSTPSFVSSSFDQGTNIDPFEEQRNQREAQRNQLRLHQAEIDATNIIFDEQLAQARLQGEGRLGSTRAMGARGGILGSDFSASQKQGQITANNSQQRAIQAERQAKIGNIMGSVRSSVLADMEDRREAYTLGADALLANLAGEKGRKQNNIRQFALDMLAQGIDITDLEEDELSEIAKEAGVSANDLTSGFLSEKSSATAAGAESALETRKTEAEISKIEADIAKGQIITLGEGTMLFDTTTGETFKNPKTYKPEAPSGLSFGGGILTQEAVSDVHVLLNESRGSDNYADTATYMAEFNGFVSGGGDPKDFIEEYDPNHYINPQDETRSFLQSEMKKTSGETLSDLEEFEQKLEVVRSLKSGG